MSISRLTPGDVVLTRFPQHLPPGHEQEGTRPAILAALPAVLGLPRFPTVFMVPLTTDRGQAWATRSPHLYPRLAAGAGRLPHPSIALLDQTRALDVMRVGPYIGTLSATELAEIMAGLRQCFCP